MSKLPTTGTNIFTIMSALATTHQAINLGQGFPDYPMDEKLIHLVNEAMLRGHNQYVPMSGYTPLLQTLSDKIANLYQQSINPQTAICITPGGTYAIYTALTSILLPGDEVIVFQPCYDSYIPNIIINGAIPVLVDLDFPGFGIDWEKVKAKITRKTKAIIINSPHNPTGTILTEKDLLALQEITSNTNITVISDEVYEHIVFDDEKHESILKYPELANRSFACFSFGKVFNATGWKLGYAVAPAHLMDEFKKVHQYNAFSCNTPMQVAIHAYLQHPESYNRLSTIQQQKRDFFIQQIQASRFKLLPSKGSFFICADYSEISTEADTNFAARITEQFKIATIPLSVFYENKTDHHIIRFCFAKKETTLQEAAEKINRI